MYRELAKKRYKIRTIKVLIVYTTTTHCPQRERRANDSMDYSCYCLVFYWGVEGVYPELAAHTFVVADDLDSNLTSIFDRSKIKEPSVYLHIPSNVDSTMAAVRVKIMKNMPSGLLLRMQFEFVKFHLKHCLNK